MATPADLQAFLAALTAANNAQAAQTQAATAALTAAAAALPAAAAVAPPVPVIPVPPAFALLPGSSAVNPLTFTTSEDMKIYNAATKGLEKKFDLKEDNLHLFLTEVKERARTFGWTDIITVPDSSVPPVARNLLTNFGQVTLANCTAHATTYYATQTRNAQNSMFLYQFLHESLTEDAKAIMVSNLALYSIADVPIGILYLKLLIGKSSIDTKAKVLLLREQVSNLHIKMGEFKGNVREFNLHVDQLRTALEGRGQQVDELIMHVFRAYEAVPDPNFLRFIQNQRDEFEREDNPQEITVEALMLLACNKFDLLNHRNALPNDTSDSIVALEAKIQSLKEGGKSSSTNDSDGNSRRRKARHPEWKLVAPKGSESKSKKVGAKTFHWCSFHKLWSIHTEKECRKGITPTPTTPSPKTEESKDELKTDPKFAAMFRAAKAVWDEDQADDDSN
jgi:hypothetical protein